MQFDEFNADELDLDIPIERNTPGRNRGYYRMQRIRKITKRSAQARQANIEVMAVGQLSKTSPFGLMSFREVARQ